MLLGQPEANLVIAGKTVGLIEFVLQRHQSGGGDVLMHRGLGRLIAEGVV
jgi:hypothetical protein